MALGAVQQTGLSVSAQHLEAQQRRVLSEAACWPDACMANGGTQ